MLHGACTADHSCTCNREHGASHWGGPMNLRPLPEGAEEVGRAARGFKMPPRIGMHPPSFDGTRSRRTRKRQTRILFNMQPNKDTLSHSTWMAAAAIGAANKQVLRVTIPRRRVEPLDTLERDMPSSTMVCGPARRHQHHLFTLHRSNNASFATPSVDDDGAGEQRDILCSAHAPLTSPAVVHHDHATPRSSDKSKVQGMKREPSTAHSAFFAGVTV